MQLCVVDRWGGGGERGALVSVGGGEGGHYENSRTLISVKTCFSLEYTISKALSNYMELNFKDEGLSNFIGDT